MHETPRATAIRTRPGGAFSRGVGPVAVLLGLILLLVVIVVTSPYHTRRALLAWQHVSGGRVPGLAHAASQAPFDAAHWWQSRRSILAVVREYLSLFNWWAGFPVRERSADAPARGDC